MVPVERVPWQVGCLHDLRDTYLTSVKGLPLDVLQRVAGHASIATTIKYYTGETDRDAERVREALAAAGLDGQTDAQRTRDQNSAVGVA